MLQKLPSLLLLEPPCQSVSSLTLLSLQKHNYPEMSEVLLALCLPEELRLKVKGAKISQIYKRLDPNKPAYTVTGSGGGGTHMYHYSEPRALTNREKREETKQSMDFY